MNMQEDTTRQNAGPDWRAAFAAGFRLSFHEYEKVMDVDWDHVLAREPEPVSYSLLKKKAGILIDNEVGQRIAGHNVIAYIPPDEEPDAALLWKCVGCAGLYRGLATEKDKVREKEPAIMIFLDTMTESVEALLAQMGEKEKVTEGIYELKNMVALPLYFVVTSELKESVFRPLRLLSRAPSDSDVMQFLLMASEYAGEKRKDAKILMDACVTADLSYYAKLKEEDEDMSDALRSLFKEEINEASAKGIEKGRALGRAEGHSSAQKALITCIRELKEGLTEAEILKQGYDANTLALAKSVI